MELSFIIINYNTEKITSNCIESILNNKYLQNIKFEIIVVDNCSSDNSIEMIRKKYPSVMVIENEVNLGFGVANNIGVSYAQGQYIVLLNSDTTVDMTNFHKLIGIIKSNEDIGVLSCKVLNEDSTIQSLGFSYPSVWNEIKLNLFFYNYNFIQKFRFKNYKDKGLFLVDWVAGCFMIIKKTDYEKINGFDSNIFMYSEDIDLCWRIDELLGKKTYVYDKCSIYHLHGKSGNKKNPSLKKLLEYKKNYYYVIEKNNISQCLSFIRFINTLHILLLWTMKKSLYIIQNRGKRGARA